MERLLELHRWDVAEVTVEALSVALVRPSDGGMFEVVDSLPAPWPRGSANEFRGVLIGLGHANS